MPSSCLFIASCWLQEEDAALDKEMADIARQVEQVRAAQAGLSRAEAQAQMKIAMQVPVNSSARM